MTNKVDKTKQHIMSGNMSLLQTSEIATKYGLKVFIPATLIIGRTEHLHSKDRMIYTEKSTNKIVIKKEAITIFQARQFIDDHILKNSGPSTQTRTDSVIPPKFILKMVEKSGASDTLVYYCKNKLINFMMEVWGSCDLILQQYVN